MGVEEKKAGAEQVTDGVGMEKEKKKNCSELVVVVISGSGR